MTAALLDGAFALVTGGSRGIGRAVGHSLAEAGCQVAVAARNGRDAQSAASEIAGRTGVRTLGIRADVSRQESVHELFVQLRSWSGDRLDVLVCNAGYPFRPEIWNTPLDATPPEKLESWYSELFQTDTLGSVLCTYEALPLMMAQRRGSIVYVASTPALEGYQGAPYTVAKAGVLGLMRDVAREYGRVNVRANAVALGNIQTPATYDSLEPERRDAMAAESALGRWGEPEEVGRVVLFLASDMSSFVTGQTLVVDGGAVRR